ncbi:hypothetical protein [Chitinilyticum aquatile]|uniref:hypothetical protein n=1 Tax=Chitinilyticum aquatile TaxID=362520 RepID=UPI0004204E38|nr:hypothetical protein [Chitinilyticum aquatile]
MVNFSRLVSVTLGLCLLVGILSWYGYSAPKPGKIVGTAARNATPALVISPPLKNDLKTLGEAAPWDIQAQQANTASAVTTETWRRVAIVTENKTTSALLQSPAGEIKTYKAGDLLPDGSKLIAVNSREVIIRPAGNNQKNMTMRFGD